jgi:hypothetical protein
MSGIVVLGGELRREGRTPHTTMATIRWEALQALEKPCAIALRIAPVSGSFADDDVMTRAMVDSVKSLLNEARAHKVKVAEFQLDFDCAQGRLADYRTWVRALRPIVHPARLVITTLPAWLDEPEFVLLVREADGYVLQVHSVPTLNESGRAVLCDVTLARKWVAKAVRIGLPFSVALPTYWCLAGYDSSGKLLGVAMDSVQPAWPRGTRVMEFATNADDLAALVKEWQTEHPSGLRELLWYRVPVATDMRNWRWATLSAVMAGRNPAHKLEVLLEGENPADISIVNTGEAEEQPGGAVTVTWSGATLVAWDALPGWTIRVEKARAVFMPDEGSRLRLSPGGKRGIGWLRYDQSSAPRMPVAEYGETIR